MMDRFFLSAFTTIRVVSLIRANIVVAMLV